MTADEYKFYLKLKIDGLNDQWANIEENEELILKVKGCNSFISATSWEDPSEQLIDLSGNIITVKTADTNYFNTLDTINC